MKTSFRTIVKNTIYLNKIILKYSPALIIVVVVSALADASLSYLNIIFTRQLVHNIQEKGITFGEILTILLLWGALFFVLKGVTTLSEQYFKPLFSKVLIKKFDATLYEKAKIFDLECYDNPKFYNDYIWTTRNAGQIVIDASNSLGVFLKYILQIGGVVSVIFIIDPSMAILTIISVVIIFFINGKRENLNWKYRQESVAGEKKRKYIERMFYLRDSAKDIRLTHINKKFMETYEEAYDELLDVTHKYAVPVWLLLFTSTFIFRYLLNTFLIYFYFAYKLVVKKSIILSDFVAVNMGMISLYLSLTRWSDQVNNLYRNILYIESMKVFIEYSPKVTSCENPLPIPKTELEIKFVNVSFQYPGESKPTLKNVNLSIKPNHMLAIVGYNGAGKTTLIKLLLRLYDVSSGEILLNGINIKKYDLNEYRKCYGVVFQDFQVFASSIGENIAMDYVTETNKDMIEKGIDFADFRERYNKMPQGLVTPMTREFEEDGVLLSGGELQKIAMSRVFAKNSKIAILDEPSSALDPISEYNINNNMRQLSDKQTIVLISHRLTSTRMADQIVMLSEGGIVEEGTHETLIRLNGEYAKIYKVQAEQYLEESIS